MSEVAQDEYVPQGVFPSDDQTSTPAPAAKPTSKRVEALRIAAGYIDNDRNASYGEPKVNFQRIADIWEIITGYKYSLEDVAMMMVGVKVARYAAHAGFNADTWIDTAGYAAIGYEVGLPE